MTTKVTPAIMIGGLGTRLWPLSRDNQPKQFLSLFGDQSFFQQTLGRFSGDAYRPAWLMASNTSMAHALRQLTDVEGSVAGIIAEPATRGTAAAIAALTLAVHQTDANGVVLVVPSDHLIKHGEELHKAIAKAVPLAEQGYVVTFGITPTAPETGFGYIRGGDALYDEGRAVGFDVKRGGFLEKPDLQTARQFVADGYLWNAGIFLFRAKTMLDELERYAPQTLKAAREAIYNGRLQNRPLRNRPSVAYLTLDFAAFSEAPADLPIDIAVIEQSERVAVVPVADLGWSDIGSLSALWDVGERDADSNVLNGNIAMVQSTGNFVYSGTGRKVVLSNTNDMIVVDTPDALLVLPRSEAQSVKTVVRQLQQTLDPTLSDTRIRRFEWGSVEISSNDRHHRILLVTLLAGSRLPRRYLKFHQETWTLLSGAVRFTSGRRTVPLAAGGGAALDPGTYLEIQNNGQHEVRLAVVQIGPGLDILANFGFSEIDVHFADEHVVRHNRFDGRADNADTPTPSQQVGFA
ncbi:MAG TPA: sugar phosphate nucleotidyltransferase [Devosiaceae bacterium]|jgi:mannose-1-phosphate guanylyltransferase/mannose-6-phosphate isomerase